MHFELPNEELIKDVLDIANQLPTGLEDEKALEKLVFEMDELAEALGHESQIEAVMEAADCVYYAIKAKTNQLITSQEQIEQFKVFSYLSGVSIDLLLKTIIAKYGQRISGGKDHQKEVQSVSEMLIENGIILDTPTKTKITP